MNSTELKSDFYKRFNEAASMLIYNRLGMPCNLLGDITAKHMPSVSCGLSMGVSVMARHIDSDSFKIENTHDNICSVMRIEDLFQNQSKLHEFTSRFKSRKICGAEILYDCDIPGVFNAHVPLRAAIMQAIARLNIDDVSDTRFLAQICSDKDNYDSFLSAISARKGWCSYIHSSGYERLPLPLSGYKILCFQSPKLNRKKYFRLLEKSYFCIKKLFPHIISFADVSHEMLIDLKLHLRSKDIFRYSTYAIEECERIQKAAAALKACRMNEFAEIVNTSHISASKLIDLDRETLFLAQAAMKSGCFCARFSDVGVTAIVPEDAADYAVKNVSVAFEDSFGAPPVICIADAA